MTMRFSIIYKIIPFSTQRKGLSILGRRECFVGIFILLVWDTVDLLCILDQGRMEPFPRQLDDETLETLRSIHAELELDEHVRIA